MLQNFQVFITGYEYSDNHWTLFLWQGRTMVTSGITNISLHNHWQVYINHTEYEESSILGYDAVSIGK
jgi:hypothetical protein